MHLFDVDTIFYLLLLFGNVIVHGQANTSNNTHSCDICIIDSNCSDDQISFNISISENCHQLLSAYFTYRTDVHPKPHYCNTSISCSGCYVDISIEPIPEAWDYILTLAAPKSSKTCAHEHVAHCGGHSSLIGWLILGVLSSAGVLLGVLVRFIKQHSSQKRPVMIKRENKEVATTNT